MQELKDRIVKEGKVLPGNIIKVDGFLNHRIDTELMDHIAEEFGKHFNMDEVTMILTAEAAKRHNLPVLAEMPIDPALAALVDAGDIESFQGTWLDGAADKVENK